MVVHTCNPNTQDADAGGLPQVQEKTDLHSEFQVNQYHIIRLFQK